MHACLLALAKRSSANGSTLCLPSLRVQAGQGKVMHACPWVRPYAESPGLSTSNAAGSLALRVDKGTLGNDFSVEQYGDADLADHPSAVRSILTRSSAEMVVCPPAAPEHEPNDLHSPQQR